MVESFGRREPEQEAEPPNVMVLPPMVLPLTLHVTLDQGNVAELVEQIRRAWGDAVLAGVSDAMAQLRRDDAPEETPAQPQRQRPVRPPIL